VFASVVGSLFAHKNGFITPDVSSFFHSVELVTMVVLGGMASIYGALIGAVILTLLPQVLAAVEQYEAMILGAIMMGTMIFMPKGLLPSLLASLKRRETGR
jgi:branched-chain amino acid transport system permease protein